MSNLPPPVPPPLPQPAKPERSSQWSSGNKSETVLFIALRLLLRYSWLLIVVAILGAVWYMFHTYMSAIDDALGNAK